MLLSLGYVAAGPSGTACPSVFRLASSAAHRSCWTRDASLSRSRHGAISARARFCTPGSRRRTPRPSTSFSPGALVYPTVRVMRRAA